MRRSAILWKYTAWFFLGLLIVIAATPGLAGTYYVDATGGRDNNDGSSFTSTWKTIAKINSARFNRGDQKRNVISPLFMAWTLHFLKTAGNCAVKRRFVNLTLGINLFLKRSLKVACFISDNKQL